MALRAIAQSGSLIALIVCVAACADGGLKTPSHDEVVSKQTRDDIARCAAGLTLSDQTVARLGVAYEREKRMFNGVASVGYEQAVRNTVLNDPDIPEGIKSKFLDKYSECMKDRLKSTG